MKQIAIRTAQVKDYMYYVNDNKRLKNKLL